MPPMGFEPTISADERPQTYALDLAATVTGAFSFYLRKLKGRISLPCIRRNVLWIYEIRFRFSTT